MLRSSRKFEACFYHMHMVPAISKFKFQVKLTTRSEMNNPLNGCSPPNDKCQGATEAGGLCGKTVPAKSKFCQDHAGYSYGYATCSDLSSLWLFCLWLLQNDVIGQLEQRFHSFAGEALIDAHVNPRKYSETLEISEIIKQLQLFKPEVCAM